MTLMDGFMTWLGLQEPQDDGNDVFPGKPAETTKNKVSNVVSLHGSSKGTMKVVVAEPNKYEEVSALVDHLRSRRQVLVNFEKTPPEESKRIFDFVLGALYALDGNSQQISKFVFLFAPSNVEIFKDTQNIMNRQGQSGRYENRPNAMVVDL